MISLVTCTDSTALTVMQVVGIVEYIKPFRPWATYHGLSLFGVCTTIGVMPCQNTSAPIVQPADPSGSAGAILLGQLKWPASDAFCCQLWCYLCRWGEDEIHVRCRYPLSFPNPAVACIIIHKTRPVGPLIVPSIKIFSVLLALHIIAILPCLSRHIFVAMNHSHPQ